MFNLGCLRDQGVTVCLAPMEKLYIRYSGRLHPELDWDIKGTVDKEPAEFEEDFRLGEKS